MRLFTTFTFTTTERTMAKKKKKKKRPANAGDIYYEYIPESGMYDPDDIDCMPDVLMPVERKNFKKLDRDEKTILKELIVDAVTTYWNKKRQIPMGESLAALKRTLVALYLEEYRVMLKDDTELKNYLRDNMIVTINKLLKKEKLEVKP